MTSSWCNHSAPSSCLQTAALGSFVEAIASPRQQQGASKSGSWALQLQLKGFCYPDFLRSQLSGCCSCSHATCRSPPGSGYYSSFPVLDGVWMLHWGLAQCPVLSQQVCSRWDFQRSRTQFGTQMPLYFSGSCAPNSLRPLFNIQPCTSLYSSPVPVWCH